MAADINRAREMLQAARTLVREGNLVEAINTLADGIGLFLQIKLMQNEKKELGRFLDKLLYVFNTDSEFKRLYKKPIPYTPGEEKQLYVKLKLIKAELEKLIVQDQMDSIQKKAEEKVSTIAKAQQYIEKGNVNVAITILKRLADEYQADTDLRTKIAGLLYDVDLYNEALGYYLTSEMIDPESVEPYYGRMAIAFWKEGNPGQAEKYFIKALEAGGEDPDLYFYWGKMCIETRELDKAYEALTKSLTIRPTFKPAIDALAYVDKRRF